MEILDEREIELAKEEIQKKGLLGIEEETAKKWAARAAAAYVMSVDADEGDAQQWWDDGEVYRNEALEHASQVSGELVDTIADALEEYREPAARETGRGFYYNG